MGKNCILLHTTYCIKKGLGEGVFLSRAQPKRLAMIITEMCGCATATLQAKFVIKLLFILLRV